MANIIIEPVNVWLNGNVLTANNLEVISLNDNLESEAKFYYSLRLNTTNLQEGNIWINGDNYIQWLANDFSTLWILQFICEQLNLTPILPTN